jgi:DNA-binding winged helix-turn-helix (wHTH) protein
VPRIGHPGELSLPEEVDARALNLTSETLWRKGARIRMQEQPFRLLASLLERPGQIVTREELCRKLWPAATHVEAARNLDTALRKVRLVLHDSPLHPRYVETVRGRGYRFLVSVEGVEPHALVPANPQDRVTLRKKRLWIGLGALAFVAMILMLLAMSVCRADPGAATPTRSTGARLAERRLSGPLPRGNREISTSIQDLTPQKTPCMLRA